MREESKTGDPAARTLPSAFDAAIAKSVNLVIVGRIASNGRERANPHTTEEFGERT